MSQLNDLLREAHAHEAAGRLPQAAQCYQRAADLDPNHLNLAVQTGIILGRLNRLREALPHFERAARIDPLSAAAHANLGTVLAKLDCHDQAIVAHQKAIELAGEQPQLLVNLALSLKQLSRFPEALALYDRAILLAPDMPEAHEYRGLTLEAMQRYDDAVESYRRAIRLRSQSPTAWNNLGTSLQKLGQTDEAQAAFREAIELRPMYAEAHNNLGTALIDARQFAQALPHYDRAIELDPAQPSFRLNRAMAYLMMGDFQRGWQEHEFRLQCPQWDRHRPLLQHPKWDGSPAPEKTLLIHAEQAFGDAIQFARFLSMAEHRCRHLIVQCQPGLERLLQNTFPKTTVLPVGQPIPQFDLQLPLLSLPAVFNTSRASLRNTTPYLKPPSDRVDAWRVEISNHSLGKKRIGLVWSGSQIDPRRALRLDQLASLAVQRNVSFFSLQLGSAALQLKNAPFEIHDLSDRLLDFAETAAVIDNLDLVISIDTAVAHLAGALARPVWILLRFSPDWRWALEPDSTPWYPTMRLFRQASPGDWTSATQLVQQELTSWLDCSAPS